MSIVLCALAKNEHLYINDFVNYYAKLGFDKIYIYDNDDMDKPFIGDYIKDKSKVEIIDVRGQGGRCFQHKVYTDFYKTHKFEWVFFCDIDEYLVGIGNIKDFLSQDKFRHINQIRVKWRLFGDDDLIERDMSKPVYEIFSHEVTETLSKDLTKKSDLQDQGKAFVRGGIPNTVIESCHFASIRKGNNVIPSMLPSGAPCWSRIAIKESYKRESVFLNHYMTKSLSEFVKQKLNRADAVFGNNLGLNYFWRINKRTKDKEDYLKSIGLLQ